MLENRFKTLLAKEIKQRLAGCLVTHLDPTENQGIPDLLILYKDKYACLEGKKSETASKRPNQEYYVNKINNDAFASFIYPENKERVLTDMINYLTGGETHGVCI